MEDRRTFLMISAAAATSRTVLGANDRVQMGVIGLGTRGNEVHDAFMNNKDVVFVAACDVQQNTLERVCQEESAA